ncbi:probable E3 ubiquitin-protein ligase XERICO isoform X1 [Lycium barbarum]|uniref:probable E3 ubiquitin-protein ligase XERICO isoform X1 n=2 Tax=Lycium barbarum TaxID=112863 RepID=UPI00293E8412|nr:probable E3 ubiquitin-protein ligase XERICO isoform X1 [Lycium barbarum]
MGLEVPYIVSDCQNLFSCSRFLFIMGLSPYTTPADAGVFCVILVNTAISISIVKGMVRSILHVIGINFASWEEYSIEGTSLDPFECRGTPSGSYMEEFRSRTPAVRYDSLCISNHPAAQECSVCLADFNHDAEINRLSCGHVFHKLCLEKWLKSWNVTCPLCRDYIMPQEAILQVDSAAATDEYKQENSEWKFEG